MEWLGTTPKLPGHRHRDQNRELGRHPNIADTVPSAAAGRPIRRADYAAAPA